MPIHRPNYTLYKNRVNRINKIEVTHQNCHFLNEKGKLQPLSV